VSNINDQLDVTITILLIFDSEINKFVIVASSWSFILFTYTDDAWSNTNQIQKFYMIHDLCIN